MGLIFLAVLFILSIKYAQSIGWKITTALWGVFTLGTLFAILEVPVVSFLFYLVAVLGVAVKGYAYSRVGPASAP